MYYGSSMVGIHIPGKMIPSLYKQTAKRHFISMRVFQYHNISDILFIALQTFSMMNAWYIHAANIFACIH